MLKWLLSFFLAMTIHVQAYQPVYYNVGADEDLSTKVLTGVELTPQDRSYFLPDDHPAKKILDKIFSRSRVLASSGAMKDAGFKLLKLTRHTMKIAKHPKLKGYLVKAYLDKETLQEWFWWKKRIDGARTIQQSIEKHGYQDIFKVPKKWVYALPAQPAGKTPSPRQYILLVEDMHLVSQEKNAQLYKELSSTKVADALYTIFLENLLIDSVYIDNVPFTKDGKIAFIDTEHFNDTTQTLQIYRFAQYFSPEMHLYWEGLLINGVQSK